MNPVPEPAIRVRDLAAGYGGVALLEGVSFEVARGEVFMILGGSGCGKSTLLKHLIGLYPPLRGEVWLGDIELVSAAGAERLRAIRRMGVMYQSGALFGSMTLLENIRLPLEEFTDLDGPAMDLIARMKLKLVGLEDYPGHLPAEISGGMQKRAAIARAMALDPEILFLDEPSAGLDPVTSAGLDNLIRRLADALGVTFVIVTHELASIEAVGDRAIMLDKQKRGIIATGSPRQLRDECDDPWVRQFFHRLAEAPTPAGSRSPSYERQT